MSRRNKKKAPPPPPAPRRSRRPELVVALFLALATLTLYSPVTGHAFLGFDDPEYVTSNAVVRRGLTLDGLEWAFTTPFAANWHPLTWISHMADVSLFGIDAGSHHLVNVLFHVANTVLLLLVLRRMTGELWPSALVAGLFALHPTHVESVAWIAERKDVLSTLFWIGTMGAYVRYVARPSPGRYALVGLLLALGLMAKSMLVTLPFVLLLLDYWPLRRTGVKQLVLEKVPLLALSAASSVATFLVQRSAGAVSDLESLPLADRVSNALVSYVAYLGKLLWPSKLTVIYPLRTEIPAWQVGGAVLLLAAITAAAWRLRREAPYLLVGWLWYLGTLVPVIGFVQVGVQAMADRYTYVPFIGLFVAFAFGVADLWRRAPRPALVAAAALPLVACFVVANRALPYWKDDVTLFTRALAVTDDNYVANYELGEAYQERGQVEPALRHYRECVRIRPGYAVAHYNLGVYLAALGRHGEAIESYEAALAANERFSRAHYNLAFELKSLGELDEAMQHYVRATELDPDYAAAWEGRGRVHMDRGETDLAIECFNDAIEADPDYALAYYNLGVAHLKKGDYSGAVKAYTECVRLDPENAAAHDSLGSALVRAGSIDESIPHYEAAIAADPTYARAYQNLGEVHRARGRYAEAIPLLEKAVELDPGNAQARRLLAEAKARQ